MSDTGVHEGRAVADEIMAALGDDPAPQSNAWWQYFFVVAELGTTPRAARPEVRAVEAAGGMTTRDGSRRRTPGGVFFVLAYERLGPKRSKQVHWRATRRVQEEQLRKLLRLLALLLPATPLPLATRAEPVAPAPPPPPAAPTAAASAAKPTRRQEPAAVEVLVVRRRPTASTAATEKPGTATPRDRR